MSLRGGSGSACLRRWARDGRASHDCRSDFSSCRRARPKSRAAARWGLLSTHARTPPSVGTWLDYVAQVSRSQQFARARSRSMREPTLQPTDDVDDRQEVRQLFANLRASLPELETLLADSRGHWAYEDGVYRSARATGGGWRSRGPSSRRSSTRSTFSKWPSATGGS